MSPSLLIGPALHEPDVSLVARDGPEIEAPDVLVERRATVAVCGVLVQVEVALVSLVGSDEERLVIRRPARKVRIQLFARGQVSDRAVFVPHEYMAQLVAAPIARVEEAAVVREIRCGKYRVRRRARQRGRVAASRRDRKGVPDPRAIRGRQNLRAIRRKRRAQKLGVLIEIGDRVPGDFRRSRRWNWRLA